jgi:hypothetical protein
MHPPAKIVLSNIQPEINASVTMLGLEGRLNWHSLGGGVLIDVPEFAQLHPPCSHAWTVKISKVR